MNGHLSAFDAKSSKKTLELQSGRCGRGPAHHLLVNGVQYIAVAAGGLSANDWPRLMAKLGRPAFGDTVAIFALTAR